MFQRSFESDAKQNLFIAGVVICDPLFQTLLLQNQVAPKSDPQNNPSAKLKARQARELLNQAGDPLFVVFASAKRANQ